MAIAGLLALALAACGGGSQDPGQATPAAAVPSPARPTAVDLDAADKFYHDGDFEEAIALYSEAAASRDAAQRRRALWSLARAQYARGQTSAAQQATLDLLASQPAPEDEARAYLLLGELRFAAGGNSDAEDALRRYVESGGPASSYARLRLAEIASRRGDWAEAEAGVNVALAQGLPPPAATDARFALARYQESAADAAGAVATYQEIIAGADSSYDRGEARWQLAQLARRLGDAQAYQDALYRLVKDQPWHPRALEALDQPQLAPAPAPSTAERALVLFEHRLNDQAAEAFRAALAEGPGAEGTALARYHLGILAERAGDPEAAVTEYEAAQAALQDNPGHELFAQASWDRALVLESLGRLAEAADAYAALADAAPQAEQAPEALFRAGLSWFRLGLPADAAFVWERYLTAASRPEAQARAYFWLARAAEESGDGAVAQHLSAAFEAAPLDYYGLRARAVAADGTEEAAAPEDVRPPPADWAAAEAWLASWAGPEDVLANQELFSGSAWRRALELASAGLQREAEGEFEALLEQATGQPWLLYRLARALEAEGQIPAAARAAARLVSGGAHAPRPVLALAYPAEYLDLAAVAARDNDLSPLLLLALVRQESFFDANAVSLAGAMGLTQVIPTTAQEIAGQLGEADFREGDLLRPRVSLRFGAHYLGSQLELFEGDPSAALAAYNGGPGNALRWQAATAGDPDVFLETIDFSETRSYVRLVLENYALYVYTYGLAEEPSLPLA